MIPVVLGGVFQADQLPTDQGTPGARFRAGVCALALQSVIFYPLPMQAHRAETTLSEDGVIVLRDIPFRRGESVEVIVFPFPAAAGTGSRYPLRGTPVTLLSPTEPVADADWESAG